ncbi:MAG: endonuclease/exonuclease/phosphatase family protein [Lachnospiraceae bacterium]|nr:endonuclease/exonuclease/phosphatase family protein [Lachnospiraceae bacterium]
MPAVWDFKKGVELSSIDDIEEIIQSIIDTIVDYDPDIVCFQEFPLLIDGEDCLKKTISEATGLKHFACIDTCPSFLFKGGRIGIATFSKEEFTENEIIYFMNPNLEKISRTGIVYKSFDKAFIVSSVSDNLRLFNCHGISFAPFGKKAKDYPESYRPLYEAIKNCDREMIVLGDLNTRDFIKIFPDLKDIITDRLIGATTPPGMREGHYFPRGKKLDSFFVTSGVKVVNVEKVKNFSDHYLCIFDCLTEDKYVHQP